MSFIRLIPTLSLKDGRIIKTIGFDRYRDVGHPSTMGKVYDSQDVDELIFADITASQEVRDPDWQNIKLFAEHCNMPLTMGGGISSIEDINRYLSFGADKIILNSFAIENPNFIKEAASTFGSQCVVVSIDCKKISDGSYEVMSCGGIKKTGRTPVDWAIDCVRLGAGEILVTSIDREGSFEGYDIDLVKSVCEVVKVPVVANGGAGLLYDLIDVVQQTSVSGVACSSIFSFTDNKPVKAKAFMEDNGIKIRPL